MTNLCVASPRWIGFEFARRLKKREVTISTGKPARKLAMSAGSVVERDALAPLAEDSGEEDGKGVRLLCTDGHWPRL